VPHGLDSKSAAAAMLQGMTAHYLVVDTFTLRPGHVCLIHAAAGGVGQLFSQLASRAGAHVIGTAGGPEKAKLAKEAGARDVIDYKSQDFEAEVKRITGGAGVHVVYDSVGKDTFEKGLKCLRPRGMMVLFGGSSGPVAPVEPQNLAEGGSRYQTRPTLRPEAAHRTGAAAVRSRPRPGAAHLSQDDRQAAPDSLAATAAAAAAARCRSAAPAARTRRLRR
jgi:NADPH2:quinone reductase